MSKMNPFGNETDNLIIGELSLENHLDKISIFGNVDIDKSKEGLDHLKNLKNVIDEIYNKLIKEENLPERIEPSDSVTGPRDPFSSNS